MHHTDYSSNLRKAQHKTLKNLSINDTKRCDDATGNVEPLRAAMAALLVIIVLLQMDPANAQTQIKGSEAVTPQLIAATLADSALKPTPNPVSDELVDSVSAVVESMNMVTPLYPIGAVLTL